jgi:integrase
LRASELRGLRWQDVDLDKRVLVVRQRADFENKQAAAKIDLIIRAPEPAAAAAPASATSFRGLAWQFSGGSGGRL